ncbi:MAG: long-chain fatty acid--CoA ligase, partial [Betaproteobacteria bacterium]|nr:long-chain fatty acid--CoA ligase [Betaproteobacteria bacterium]
MTPLEVLQRYPAHDYTLLGALTSRARSIPEHCFIEFGDARLSYAQTAARVREAMALLAAKGVKPGDRIALMSHNHPTTVVLLIALAALGAIMVGVNPDFGEKEARYVLEHSEASGIVCSLAALATVQAVAGALPARPWIMSNEPNLVGLPTVPGALHGTGDAAPATIGLADDVCIIIYTSGTTGFPKGVMHSQRSVVLAGEGFVRRMHLDPAERLLCIMPMFHVNAIFYSLFGTIAAGATLLLEEKFSASQFWSTVARRKATTVNTIAAV